MKKKIVEWEAMPTMSSYFIQFIAFLQWGNIFLSIILASIYYVVLVKYINFHLSV